MWLARQQIVRKKKKEGNLMEQQIALRVLEARAKIADHLLDDAVYIALAFSLFDLLHVEAGLTLRSFLAFRSAGTLIFSLASKDLATQLVNGLTLSASDKV
jgi:small-conductance mechanosensitive channel